jgi:hypothetical protein
VNRCNDGNLTSRGLQKLPPMLSLPPELRIANAAAVLDGPYGEITQRAHQLGLSRQALYRDTQAVLQTLDGGDTQRQLQQLREQMAPIKKREPVSIVRAEPPPRGLFFVFFLCAFDKLSPSLSTSLGSRGPGQPLFSA